MAIIFEDGFETGDISRWDAAVVTSGEHISIDSVAPIHGAYSLLCTSEKAGPDQYAMVKKTVSMDVCYARGYFRVNGGLPLPASGDRINLIIFYWCANVAIGRDGGIDQFQLRVSNVTGTPTWIVKNTGIEAKVGQVYCVELVWIRGQKTELYIDGVKVAECLANEGMRDRGVDDVRFGLGVTVTTGHTGLSVSADSCVIADSYIGPIKPPAPKVYFEDNFETGAFKPDWSITTTTGETASVSSTFPAAGRFHADFQCDGLPGTAGEMAYAQISVPSLYDCYVRQYVCLTGALPPSGMSYVPLNLRTRTESGYALAYLYISGGATPKFGLYWCDQAGAHYTLSNVPVELNRYYCVEVHVKVGAGDGAYELWIDGQKVIVVEGVDNLTARAESPYLGGPVNYIQIGERWASKGAPAHGVYVDEFVVADSYVGPIIIETGTLECHAFVDNQEVEASVVVQGVGTYKTPFTVDLPVGTYTLTATYAGQTQEKTVTIVAGQTSRVDFQFALVPAPAVPLTGPLGIWSFPLITWIGALFPRVYSMAKTLVEDIKKRWKGAS